MALQGLEQRWLCLQQRCPVLVQCAAASLVRATCDGTDWTLETANLSMS